MDICQGDHPHVLLIIYDEDRKEGDNNAAQWVREETREGEKEREEGEGSKCSLWWQWWLTCICRLSIIKETLL